MPDQVTPNFKKGVPLPKKRQTRHQGMRWRHDVLTRDGYRCQVCGHRDLSGATISAHHVIFKSHCANQYRWDDRNGLTLCNGFGNGCHENLHGLNLRLDPRRLPGKVLECLEEQGLTWDDEGQPRGPLRDYFTTTTGEDPE